jgi:hypothetical protein
MLFIREEQTRKIFELMKKYVMNFNAFKSKRKKEKTFVLRCR